MGGIDIYVEGTISSSKKLELDWLQSLSENGLDCEFYPGEELFNHDGGVWLAKVTVKKNSFPKAKQYPQNSCFVCFNSFSIGFHTEKKNQNIGDRLDTSFAHYDFGAWLNNDRGNLLNNRFFYFAGATLALVSNGVCKFWDENQNTTLSLTGKEAIDYAQQKMEYLESFSNDIDGNWYAPPFTSWDDEEYFPNIVLD